MIPLKGGFFGHLFILGFVGVHGYNDIFFLVVRDKELHDLTATGSLILGLRGEKKKKTFLNHG